MYGAMVVRSEKMGSCIPARPSWATTAVSYCRVALGSSLGKVGAGVALFLAQCLAADPKGCV